MKKRKIYHVIQRGRNWIVKLEDSKEVVSSHSHKKKAIVMAQKVAQSLEAKVYIHRKVGYISQKRGHAKKRDQLRKTRLKRAQQFNQHRNLNVRRNRANRHRLSKQTLTPRVAIHRPANIEVRNISSQRDTQSEQNSIDIWIDPGNAKKTELAELYSALSELYRAHGGIGIDFRDEGTKIYSVDKSSS